MSMKKASTILVYLKSTLHSYVKKSTSRVLYPTLFIFMNFLLAMQALEAQNQNLRFSHITRSDGLSQNIVNSIFQDSRGFMWIGTNEGLNKYDGYEFTIFEKGDADGYMLSDDVIQCIFEDDESNIWVGTGSGGANIFNRKENKFSYLDLDSITIPYLNSKNIKSILQDKQGMIWLIAGNAIVKLNKRKEYITSFIPSHFNKTSSNKSNLSIFFADSSGNIWFGTGEDGLGFFDISKETFEYFSHDPENNATISDNDIRSIYEDKQGRIWIGTYNGGLNLFDRDKRTFIKYIPNNSVRESFTIKTIIEDEKNNLWIGTRNGLYIFNTTTHKFNNYIHDPYNPYSINQNNVQTIYKDRNNNIWLGTKRGINLLKNGSTPFTYYRTDAHNHRCLNSSLISSIIEDKQGNIWFGTSEGGLNVLNKETGIFTYYTHDINDKFSISSNNINNIAEDKEGNLWIGTTQGGLNFFDVTTKRFTCFKRSPDLPFVYQPSVNWLFFIREDLLLVTSENDVLTFNTKEKKFKSLKLFDDLPSIITSCTIKGNGDYIWIGTGSSKIYRVDISSLEKKEYPLPELSRVTRITRILALDDMVWLGTTGGGLLSLSENGDVSVYKKEDGLPNNYITGILPDNEKNLWISTLDGLAIFNPVKKNFINLYVENGLQNNQFTFGNMKSRSGEFYFGDIDGAISFNPENISTTPFNATVLFTDFKIFNQPVEIGGEENILSAHISESTDMTLPYNKSSFTFTFSALDYTMNDKIEYAYIMEGFEDDWNYVGNRRYATYTNLDPGNYTFCVKAANNAGQWSPKQARINIVISPPYWATWWFRSLILSIIILIMWHFSNYLLQKRNLLKATALANSTQLKLLRNQMNPHFLLNAFSVIRALVLIDKEKAWEMISKLSEFFRYMLLNYSREKDTLSDEIEAAQNYISIQKVCFHESLEVDFDIAPTANDLIVPAFIFQPLIENAIKYGSQTSGENFKIRTKITYENDLLVIDIANTGKLVSEEEKNHEDKKAHGTSIKNIKKRLNILFRDKHKFELFEENGWVHAIIKIEYQRGKIKPEDAENEL